MTTAPRTTTPSTGDAAAASPAELYAEGLAHAAAAVGLAPTGHDQPSPFCVRDESGAVLPIELDRFVARLAPGDASLLDRCTGPTLDVGCGPGRLVAALGARGVAVLGIDVTRSAVRLARARAGSSVVLERSVFERVPGAGRWSQVLLADGNVGIGGDPVALLARVADLLAPDGHALVETAPPGTGLRTDRVRLEGPAGRVSAWFPWARSDVDGLTAPAAEAGLVLAEAWSDADRYFCALRRAD